MDGLAISLAKAGYDVWLGNNRGNIFSNEHEKLDWAVDEKEYWDFSFPELGTYDLPAMVETVVEETNGRKVRYIGTSLGTTQMFYALQSDKTKQFLEDNLHQVIAMAPVFVPRIEPTIELNKTLFSTYTTLMEMSHMEYQVFGPGHDGKVDGFCDVVKFIDDLEETCDELKTANDDPVKGFGPISSKIL